MVFHKDKTKTKTNKAIEHSVVTTIIKTFTEIALASSKTEPIRRAPVIGHNAEMRSHEFRAKLCTIYNF